MAEFVAAKSGETEQQWRQFMAFLFAQSSVGKAVSGVLTGLGVTQTTTASSAVVVGAGCGTIQAATNDGVSPAVTSSAKSLDILTANPVGGLPRNDLVVWDSATGTSRAIIGTPAATPSDPTVPTSAIPLARVRNAASATTIPTSAIDDLRAFTSLFWVNSNAPFAQAAGLAAGFSAGTLAAAASINATVSLPAGRFTQAPIIQCTLQTGPGGSASLVARALSVTTTSFGLYVFNAGASSTSFSGLTVAWTAIQMTSASAAG